MDAPDYVTERLSRGHKKEKTSDGPSPLEDVRAILSDSNREFAVLHPKFLSDDTHEGTKTNARPYKVAKNMKCDGE